MTYTDSSFTNIAAGTEILVVEKSLNGGAHRTGTFISASGGSLTIYWKTYDKNKSWSYGEIEYVEIAGKLLYEDGSIQPDEEPDDSF